MMRMTRRRLLVGGVLVLLAGALAYAFRAGPTLDGSEEVDGALPTDKDLDGYASIGGVVGVLSPPGGYRNEKGKALLTGSQLDAQCRTYRKEKDGWACRGLRGMGMTGFVNTSDVNSRLGSFVLAYKDDAAAGTAFRRMVNESRDDLHAEEQKEPDVGDESRSFRLESAKGSVVVLRCGSVVAQVLSNNGYGYSGDEGAGGKDADPIRMWADRQAEKIEEAL
ncbi:hypothetical protein QF035_010763 [Streptomyces umbrinus]|uniref:Secreted protein n=1 Tax=Streptomyces umbrinus TaxID=67370 RepID=A0ABU0TBI3_9ACTN|nr:hypothetical protein [Streptomyces umbrinus]MDQ1033181.1 hypothetical protein [Streptomyces umbrinus]